MTISIPRRTRSTRPQPTDPATDPRSTQRRGRLGLIVAASLAAGGLAALILVVGVVAGAPEHVITGTAMLSLAAGWVMLAVLSRYRTDQPQRWALVPAAGAALVGAALLILAPGDPTLAVLGWLWPPVLLALAAWIVIGARRHLHNWSRTWLLYPVTAALAVAAIGGIAETVLESTDHSTPAAQGQMVDVGGRHLYLECHGTGSPTVVLSNGLGEHTPHWAWITAAVARDTRVCTYDRAGQGWSDPAPAPQDGLAIAADLHTLLDRAHVPGPYVLAGHSTGGVYALTFAAQYPADVAAVVLLDSATPEQFTALPDYPNAYAMMRRAYALFPSLARTGLSRILSGNSFSDLPAPARTQEQAFAATAHELRSQRDEITELPTAFNQAKALHDLHGKPLVVLTADQGQQRGWFAAQDKLATLSSNSTHRTAAGATHEGLLEDQQFATTSSQAIHDAVQAVRTHTPLHQ